MHLYTSHGPTLFERTSIGCWVFTLASRTNNNGNYSIEIKGILRQVDNKQDKA